MNELIKINNDNVNLEERLKNTENLSEVKVLQIQQSNEQCGLITFEGLGLGNNTLIPLINLGFTVATFDTTWLSLISGSYSNEPSPTTIAYLALNNFGDIVLSNPVASVSLYYISLPNIIIEAYDLNGNLLSSDVYPGNYQVDGFTQWDQITINLGSNVISRIRIIGSSNQTAIDNVQLCLALTRGIRF